jgi:hypothetical protein
MTTVSIIGSSGRAGNITKEKYIKMIQASIIYLRSLSLDFIVLVSGGAAFADHIAVHLYLHKNEYQLNIISLQLDFPCKFDMITKKFEDNGNYDWKENPGKVANYYHDKFNAITGNNSYEELYKVINLGAETHVHKGFHSRNQFVAKSEYMLAFTFGKDFPEDGGTKHTWDLCKGKKFHISLL